MRQFVKNFIVKVSLSFFDREARMCYTYVASLMLAWCFRGSRLSVPALRRFFVIWRIPAKCIDVMPV